MSIHEYTTHERPIRIALHATTTRPPGRRREWTAEVNSWRAEGTTEKAATDALTARLQLFMASHRQPLVLTYGGYVAVVSLELGDDVNPVVWCNTIVDPEGRSSYSGHSGKDWTDAEGHARYLLAHRCTDWYDDASVHAGAAYLLKNASTRDHENYGPEALYEYASWQRAAKAAMAEGRPDWHEWATTHRAQFPIPPAEATNAAVDGWSAVLDGTR